MTTQTQTARPAKQAAPPRMTQRERSERARGKLLDSAIDLICENGFAGLRMSDIAARAGMTRGAIQHHFEGRDDVVIAILQEVEDRISRGFDRSSIKPDMTIERRLDALIEQFARQAMSPDYLAVLDIWMTTRAEPELKEVVRESMLRASKRFSALWLETFEDQVPAKVIADCRRLVVSVMRGAVFARILVTESRSFKLTVATLKTMARTHMLGAMEAGEDGAGGLDE